MKIHEFREFPGGPMVRTRCFQCPGLIPGQGLRSDKSHVTVKKEKSLAPNLRSQKKNKRMNIKSRRVKLTKARTQCGKIISKGKIALMIREVDLTD